MRFAPQKGANAEQVQLLDEGLRNLARVILRETGVDVSSFRGAGAAGGIAAGLKPYMSIEVVEGTQLMLEASDLERNIDDADLIITGEGKIDRQSLDGKTISAIVALAKRKNIPVAALCGKLELSESEWKKEGLSFADDLITPMISEEDCMRHAFRLLEQKSASVCSVLKRI